MQMPGKKNSVYKNSCLAYFSNNEEGHLAEDELVCVIGDVCGQEWHSRSRTDQG